MTLIWENLRKCRGRIENSPEYRSIAFGSSSGALRTLTFSGSVLRTQKWGTNILIIFRTSTRWPFFGLVSTCYRWNSCVSCLQHSSQNLEAQTSRLIGLTLQRIKKRKIQSETTVFQISSLGLVVEVFLCCFTKDRSNTVRSAIVHPLYTWSFLATARSGLWVVLMAYRFFWFPGSHSSWLRTTRAPAQQLLLLLLGDVGLSVGLSLFRQAQ